MWNQQVKQLWPQIRFLEASAGPDVPVHAGASLPLRARIDLAGLSAADVRVEALVGRIGPQGDLEEAQVLTLDPPRTTRNGVYVWDGFCPADHRTPGIFRPRDPQSLRGPLESALQRPYEMDGLVLVQETILPPGSV